LAKTDPDEGGKGISAFLVEPGFAGFAAGRMRQDGAAVVAVGGNFADDCVVPGGEPAGRRGAGGVFGWLKIALSALDGGRIGIAAQAVAWRKGRWKRR